MAAELEQKLQQGADGLLAVIHRLAATARFMERPVFMAEIREAITAAVLKAQSDVLDRKAASAWFCISESQLDAHADAGLIRRDYSGSKPLFSKQDIEAALRSGKLAGEKLKAA